MKKEKTQGLSEPAKGWVRNLDARIDLTPAASAIDGNGAKLSISLFASDMARLEEIRSYMAARGHHISVSQAVKLALRTAPLSKDLIAALADIRKEDGRSRRA